MSSKKTEKAPRTGLLSFLCKGYKKDIFGEVLTGFEPRRFHEKFNCLILVAELISNAFIYADIYA